MSARVVVRDRGANSLLRAVEEGHASHWVKVGIIGSNGDKTYEEGESIAEVAEKHEFGIGVPQRSWLRGYVDPNVSAIENDLRSIARMVLIQHRSVMLGLGQLGAKSVGGIQARIASRIPPDLAPLTLALRRHGGDVPLIDTGQLRSSISFLTTVIDPGSEET